MTDSDSSGLNKAPGVPWLFWIDTGGTFTDCIAFSPEGTVTRAKILSTGILPAKLYPGGDISQVSIRSSWSWNREILTGYRVLTDRGDEIGTLAAYDASQDQFTLDRSTHFEIHPGVQVGLSTRDVAPVTLTRLITGTRPGERLPPIVMRLGTTKATNALLERKGAKTAFVTNTGIEDLLQIGTQQRPDLFALNILKPEPLPFITTGITGRMLPDGEQLIPVAPGELVQLVENLRFNGIQSVAISLLHGYKNPGHELQIAEYLRSQGFRYVTTGGTLFPVVQLLPRSQTAVVDAYLNPLMMDYFDGINAALGANLLQVTTSTGFAVRSDLVHSKDTLLSGPAGGVRAAVRLAAKTGADRLITFDMGGTSTDCSRIDRREELTERLIINHIELATPSIAIETVAAGGGSICRINHGKAEVGPESAGAQPGPACYGSGGPLTITDVNLLLGRIDPATMEIPIDSAAALAALRKTAGTLFAEKDKLSSENLLRGFLEIANERMASAVRAISVGRGFDPRDYTLLSFGGAGGLHACDVADKLGIREVIFPYDAGIFSALGVGVAPVARIVKRQVNQPLEQVLTQLDELTAECTREAFEQLDREGPGSGVYSVSRKIASLMFKGQANTIDLDFEDGAELAKEFLKAYQATFGYIEEGEIELDGLAVIAESADEATGFPGKAPAAPVSVRYTEPYFGGINKIPVYDWETGSFDQAVDGPAVIVNSFASYYLPHGWTAAPDGSDMLRVSKTDDGTGSNRMARSDTLELELFRQRFQSIAGEMGEQLKRTAISVNVKQRLDFSCAILDPDARLLANAAHIPVHLGSLGMFGRTILRSLTPGPGDVIVCNHPAYGGSHLPDISTLAGAFTDDGRLIGYVVTRAHHAEIGGTSPGSMPVGANSLAEEGVIIEPTYLLKNGIPRFAELKETLTGAAYPTRNWAENIADLRAAVAASNRGVRELQRLAGEHTLQRVIHYMSALTAYSARVTRDLIARFPADPKTVQQRLDDGSVINLTAQRKGHSLVLDFNGTSGVRPGNMNCTAAIVQSAVLYVLRLLIEEPLPLNEGILDPVEIILPECFLAPAFVTDPARCPAVAAGNTETSQRLTDAMLLALGDMACGQGTMNNVVFGNAQFGYYETVGGGAGASGEEAGASAVHQHMTNTRITDPEDLEIRYPVRLLEFSVRRGSGGRGRFNGGDGIVRKMQFLEEVELTFIGEHRKHGACGIHGGEPGARGRQSVVRRTGATEKLDGHASVVIYPGDIFLLETPGGGGYGTPEVEPAVGNANLQTNNS